MRCLDNEMLVAYLKDALPFEKSQNVQSHLLTCGTCQLLFEQYLLEPERNEAGAKEEWQTDTIIERVLDRVPPYPLNVLKRVDRYQADLFDGKKRINGKKRSVVMMKKATLAAAGLALVVSLGTLVYPGFATYVQGVYYAANPMKEPYTDIQGIVSLYAKEDTDAGVLQAAQQGYVKPLHLKAVDQGLTLEAKAVLADPAQIMVLGSLTDKDGKKLNTFWEDRFSRNYDGTIEANRVIRLKDKTGNVLRPQLIVPKMPDPLYWNILPNGENFIIQSDLRNFFPDPSKLPDEMILEVQVRQLGKKEGNWNWDIPIDLRLAKAATKTVSVQQQFTTPQGEKIDFKEVRFGPSATQLMFTTNNVTAREKGIRYHLIDEQGAVLATWDDVTILYGISAGEKLYQNVSFNLSHGSLLNTGLLPEKYNRVHSFYPIDRTKSVTLKMDAVYTAEKADFRAKLPITELKKNPITVTEEGNRITFTRLETQTGEKEAGKDRMTYIFHVEGTLTKDIAGITNEWRVMDENGESEKVLFFPSLTIAEDGTRKLSGTLKVSMKNKDAKEFTISYDEKIKQHPVTWEVPIPQK
ncbi:DUF4179 domain-containing protein [Brevibacillus ruminantium]|uniref:DUF4179 domain-containing protein n=1 Tax=Brevibacillus ruminantium TaxID=2950604 RepID=A0ABY4WCZ4_9BACL|nr:DUF4179 domain-containing protein [Brevibacillus ruminantium]USG65046.1 DUF4179 domain-containing protein [Brevibacillus ruminantium]